MSKEEFREYALNVCRDSALGFNPIDDPELVERLVRFVSDELCGPFNADEDVLTHGLLPTHILHQPHFVSGGPGFIGEVYHLFFDDSPGSYIAVVKNSQGFKITTVVSGYESYQRSA